MEASLVREVCGRITVDRLNSTEIVKMPLAGETATPQRTIARTIERIKRGEKVIALAKELGVSRSAVYLWLAEHKRAELERIKKAALTPAQAEKADKRDLALENEALRAENKKLWSKVQELMLKYGEI